LIADEQARRQRMLGIILWTALIATAILGWFDIQFNTPISVISLFGTAGLCVPLLVLNAQGRFTLAASLLSLAVLAVITANLYDGDGVRDPGILAYPLFIMIGTLFFGKRAAPYFTLAAIASIALIVYLEVGNNIHPRIGPTKFSILIPMTVLFVAAAIVVWVIMNNLQINLEHARRAEAELRMNYDLTLEAWAKVLEYRDRETEGHSRRLVDLSTRLAQALELNEAQIVQLRRGALIHDIGKLAIPDEVLLKPDSLTEGERDIIQKHPVYAKQMLSQIPFLQPTLEVAYSHHERWDGQGYPEGLKGEAIPLLARIFAVVDTWDALHSQRVYRPGWPPEQIEAYLKENAGIRYDPHIVEVFLGLAL